MKNVQAPSTVVVPAGRICPRCGAPLGGFGPEGLCGACLFDSGLAAEEPTTELDLLTTGSRRFGDYELLEEIARGGMGVIFKARQLSLNRIVALKMILRGEFASVGELARFRAEAETAARLQHANIVAIHEVGEREGLPYFSMDYVEGQNLAQFIGNTPLPAMSAAKYLKTIAEAVQYAHQHGVLHRDLKPSNVLIDANDQPRITDFGLAKRLASTSDSGPGTTELTLTGQVLGSPNFMPPEQAAGKNDTIGPASDVYSLGAILYHALTGRPPFVAESMTATLRLVAECEAVSPRLLVPTVPRDLETICLKCLQKEPQRRYTTALELAKDVHRFLQDEPIHARATSGAEKAWRWCQRKPAAAAAIALLLVVAIGSPIAALRINRERQRAEANATKEEAQRERAEANAGEAREQQHLAAQQELLARRRFYAAQMNLANQAWETGRLPRTMDLLETQRPLPGQTDLRGFEWFHLWGLCNERNRFTFLGHTGNVNCVAFSPDGNTLASGGEDGTIRLWNTATGHEKMTLKLDSAYPIISSLVFTPDGKTLACGSWDRLIRLYDVHSGQLRATRSGHPGFVRCLAVSPDGKTLASGGESGVVKLWDLATGEVLSELKAHQGVVLSLAFSSDNMTLATGSGWGELEGGLVVLWNLSDGAHARWKVARQITSLTLSPDNQTLAMASWDQIGLLDTSDGQSRGALTGHLPQVNSVAFLPDGKSLVSCASDRTIRLWPWSAKRGSGALSRTIGGHLGLPLCLAVAPDGAMVASGANDGSVKLWNMAEGQSSLFTRFKSGDQSGDWSQLESLQPSPRTNVVFVTTRYGTEVRDIATARKHSLWPDAIGRAALSRDGRLLATGSQGGLVKLWETDTGQLLASVQAHMSKAPAAGVNGLRAIAFSADGRILATACYEEDTSVRLWDTEAGLKPIRSLAAHAVGVSALGFSPDGKTLAVGVRHTKLLFFDISSGALNGTIIIGKGAAEVGATVFSPDGKLLASCGLDAPVLWDVESGQARVTLRGHAGAVGTIVFSPDGDTVATGGDDSTVRLWDAATGQERITFNVEDKVNCVAFSGDGNTLFGASQDGIVRLWRKYPGGDADKSALGAEGITDARPSEDPVQSLARRGRWQEATARLRQSIEANPDDSVPYFYLAPILLLRGEIDEYRRLCQRMFSQFAGTTDPAVADRIGKACLIYPASGVDASIMAEWADTAVRRGQTHELRPWFELCKALAEYRQNHFAGAADWAQLPLASAGKPLERDACVYLVLAMAQMQLKQDGAARIALDKAAAIADEKIPKLDSADLGDYWVDIIIADQLMREARALIEGIDSGGIGP